LADKESSYKRRLPAGFLDSAFASLATFAVGLAAVNLLDDVNRGVYTVYFTAFMLGTVLARNLIYTPAEVQAVSYPNSQRLSVIRHSITLGIAPGFVGALAAVIAYFVTSGYATADVSVALMATTAITIVLSPMQDHVRRMLHIAAWSWRAAWVSIVQFAAVVIAAGSALIIDVPVAWVPFGALAVANAVSLSFAWVVGRYSVDDHAPHSLSFVELARKGVWLVVQAGAPAITGFAVAATIAALASPEDLGYAESARVVAQPILVLAAGLTAVLAPRSMRAAMDRDRATAARTRKIYLLIMVASGLGYAVIAGWDWVLNPMTILVPSAYVVSGLVAVTVLANIALSSVFLQMNELLGAHRERRLAAIAWTTSPIALLFGFTAGVTGAFARPLGSLVGATARYALHDAALGPVYEESAGTESTDQSLGPVSSGDDGSGRFD
jgi:O-antigen/teichoic acid export membrane protein